jgi:hypothetical protein
MSAGELLGFDPGGAALHVHDLAVPEGDDYRIPSSEFSVLIPELRGPDHLVVADTGEGQIVDRPAAACLQDLTGLAGPASGGCVLPPEVAVRWAAPLGVLCEERCERLGIAAIHRLGCGAKLVDHDLSMAKVDESSVSARWNAHGRNCVADEGPRLGQCSRMTPEEGYFRSCGGMWPNTRID